MKRKELLLMIVMILCYTISHAQTKFKTVAAAAEALRVAMVDGNAVMLAQLADDSLTYGHSTGRIQNKAEFINALTDGSSDFVSIDILNQTIKQFGNTAIIRHTLSAVTNDNGKPGTVKLYILLVWKKAHHTWKLIARQAVKVP